MKRCGICILVLTIASACFGPASAQVVNRALEFSGTGYVDCGYLTDMEGKDSYSLQFWMDPLQWSPGASLISYGDGFSVKLGSSGEIVISSGDKSLKVSSPSLKPDEWTQVTLICDKGNTEVLVDGTKVAEGILPAINTSGQNHSFKIGENFIGTIDEVRVWNNALNDEMEKFDYFIFNTINKWNPMWENLVAYYKMDQPDSSALVEFKAFETPSGEFNNHGIFYGDVKRVEAKNDKMPYLVNAAYTENPRFYTTVTPKDQYLLHNELIILGTDVYGEDGRIETKTPNNHALSFSNTSFVPEFENRDGILILQGDNNSYFSIPLNTLLSSEDFTIEAWIYLDGYSPNGILLRKSAADSEGDLEIKFGKDSQKQSLEVIFGEKEIISADIDFPLHEWFKIAISSVEEEGSPKVKFLLNGKNYPVNEKDVSDAPLINKDSQVGVFIGEGLKGKIDEIVIWNKAFSEEELNNHFVEGIPSPGYGYPVSRADMNAIGAYYKFDNAEDLGHSYHSQDEWLAIMKRNYEGREGIKYYISVQGTYRVREKYGDWRQILESPEKRQRFAHDLAEISKNYDGAELDLEWIENQELWEHFGLLAQDIREAMPEDKEFRISLHNNFTAFPPDKMKYVDGFTLQQYGPQASNFSYENFKGNVKKFESLYEPHKIMTSYSTTTSRGDKGSPVRLIKGEVLDNYIPNDNDQDSFTIGEETWKFMGPMQVYKRARDTRDQNLRGIFYWVINDDNWEEVDGKLILSPNNQAKYSSFGINANTDPIIHSVTVRHP